MSKLFENIEKFKKKVALIDIDGSKKTYGQMNRNTKAKIDHRSVAFKKLKKKLKFNKFFI